MMRIITGTARGTKLFTLPGDTTRPTTEFAKEAIFNTISSDIEGRNVLDLFAGSGQMGLETLSRGAKHCVFTDSSKEAIEVVRRNCEKTKLSDRAEVRFMDAMRYVKSVAGKTKFDLIFVDPPYEKKIIPSTLKTIAKCDILSDTGIIVCEDGFAGLTVREPQILDYYDLIKEASYGRLHIFYLKKKAKND